MSSTTFKRMPCSSSNITQVPLRCSSDHIRVEGSFVTSVKQGIKMPTLAAKANWHKGCSSEPCLRSFSFRMFYPFSQTLTPTGFRSDIANVPRGQQDEAEGREEILENTLASLQQDLEVLTAVVRGRRWHAFALWENHYKQRLQLSSEMARVSCAV